MRTNWHCGRLFFSTLFILAFTTTNILAKPPEELPPVCPSQAPIVMESGTGSLLTPSIAVIPFDYDQMRHINLSLCVFAIWNGSGIYDKDVVQVQFDFLDESGNVVAGALVANVSQVGGQCEYLEFDATNWEIVLVPHPDRPVDYGDIHVVYNYTTTHSTSQ